jgi:hypothetical protein
MLKAKPILLAVLSCAVCGVATAAILPSWRVNNIPTAATTGDPLLNGAVSVSLLITLSGGSQFNVAGVNINQGTFAGPFSVYNIDTGELGNFPPIPDFHIFPHWEFDTYVTTTNGASGAHPILTGTASGLPGAVFGPDRFDVAWDAAPNTGSDGTFEIARITLLGAFAPGSTPIAGEVRDSLNPNTAVPLPNLPFVIPEPGTLTISLCMGGIAVSCRRRSSTLFRRRVENA